MRDENGFEVGPISSAFALDGFGAECKEAFKAFVDDAYAGDIKREGSMEVEVVEVIVMMGF